MQMTSLSNVANFDFVSCTTNLKIVQFNIIVLTLLVMCYLHATVKKLNKSNGLPS